MMHGRWIRIVAVAIAALVLASCRSITAPVMTAAAVVAEPAESRGSDEPRTVIPASGISEFRRHTGALRAGLEAPSPPLPRLESEVVPAGYHRPNACGPACQPLGTPCPDGSCPMPMVAYPPAIPVIGPLLVCDGGDRGSPARAVGRDGLTNLTAGDTVARYRPADDQPDSDDVRLVESNCACVYAPRFGAVREVSRPLEDARPVSPGGLVNEQLANLQVERLPVAGSVQNIAPEGTRKALPGVALRERLGPLAVDQDDAVREGAGVEGPNERWRIEKLDLARRRQQEHTAIGFDVPLAWTTIKSANVLMSNRSAHVVAADRGTAVLRFESPGRAELTLCKRAGTDTARVGEEIDFMIYLLNSGDRPLTGIVLADAVPTRLEFVPDSAASSLPADFSTETGDDGSVVLTWRLTEPLPAGGSGFVRFRAMVR